MATLRIGQGSLKQEAFETEFSLNFSTDEFNLMARGDWVTTSVECSIPTNNLVMGIRHRTVCCAGDVLCVLSMCCLHSGQCF